jgi:hypothetical protein
VDTAAVDAAFVVIFAGGDSKDGEILVNYSFIHRITLPPYGVVILLTPPLTWW